MEALRARLASLSFTDNFDTSSAPLVQKLVEDLVRTRADLVQSRQQAGRQAHELINVDDKVRFTHASPMSLLHGVLLYH